MATDIAQCEQCGMFVYDVAPREGLASPADQRQDAKLCGDCFQMIRREMDEFSQWLDDNRV